MAGCSPVFWKCGEHRHSMTGESNSPSTISPKTCSFSVCTRRDLPRPASPMSNTTCPMPSFACSQRSLRRLTSVSRPVNGATLAIADISLGSGTGPEGDDFEAVGVLTDRRMRDVCHGGYCQKYRGQYECEMQFG